VRGKQAKCQVLVWLILARKEVPEPLALQRYVPEDWAQDEARRAAARVHESIPFAPKGDIALAPIDAALADGVCVGMVLADAGYGSSAAPKRTRAATLHAAGVRVRRRNL
jgi:SRSO17 transposase